MTSIRIPVLFVLLSACVPQRPVPELAINPPHPERSARAEIVSDYHPVSGASAERLGCHEAGSASPVCEVAHPTAEEISAFRAESLRLSRHAVPECRALGAAILHQLPNVRMYRRSVVRQVGSQRLYGTGHTYEIDNEWRVRVARRIDDLNPRTLDEMTRTLRHEVSHTIGAEESGDGWNATRYADECD